MRTFMNQFILRDEDVNTLKRLFDKEIDEGLKTDERSNPADISSIKMGVTHFTEFFDGTGQLTVDFLFYKFIFLFSYIHFFKKTKTTIAFHDAVCFYFLLQVFLN